MNIYIKYCGYLLLVILVEKEQEDMGQTLSQVMRSSEKRILEIFLCKDFKRCLSGTLGGGISTISRFNAADSDSKIAGKSVKLKLSIKKIITLS